MRVLAAACLAIMIVPFASAGSAEDPEVIDDSASSHPDANRDIVAAWIDDEPVDLGDGALGLTFRVQTKAAFQHMASAHAVHERYRFAFVPDAGLPEGAAEAYVNLRPSVSSAPGTSAGSKTMSCQFGAAAAGASQALTAEITLSGSFDGGVFSCVLPLTVLPDFDLGQHALRGLYVTHELIQRGPLGGSGTGTGDLAGVTILRSFDRAPGSGVGRDWSAAVPSEAPGVLFLNATTFPVDLAQAFTEPHDGTYRLNWTSPGGNLSLGLGVAAGNGSVSLQILVGNQSVYASNVTGSGNHTLSDVPAGNGTVILSYQAFQGNVTLAIGAVDDPTDADEEEDHTPDDVPGPEDGGDGNATGNETLDDGNKDTPLPFIVPALGLVMAAAARRRR